MHFLDVGQSDSIILEFGGKSMLIDAGETAYVFKTEYNGKPLYLISLDEEFNYELKVTQPSVKLNLEARVEALEKKLHSSSEVENKGVGPLRFERRIPAV